MNCFLIQFICKYIPLKQWAFDDSHSSKYQKLKIDELPKIISFKQEWNWTDLISFYQKRYGKTIKPVFRHGECNVPTDCTCPQCNALVHEKDRKHFIIHKCVNKKCPYYLKTLKKVSKEDLSEDYGKNTYKLHYIYREFDIDFFKKDSNSLPTNASSLKFSKFDKNVMGLCLTYKINLGLSLRKTAQALKDIHGISNERDVGACVLAMRMAFNKLKKLPENFRFIADGYSAYVLAAQQFLREFGEDFKFEITQVIRLTNDDANYDLALWVTYYNFLRPHERNHYRVLNEVDDLKYIDNMPGK